MPGLVLLSVSFTTAIFAQTLPIYTDGLRSGFEDWGWAPHTLTNVTPVHSGDYSISISAAAWSGLFFHHADMDTQRYTNLTFWAHGGESGGQILRIGAKLGTNDQPGYSLDPLPANKWVRYTVPLEFLGVANKTNLSGFLIQVRDDCPTNTFYLDDLELQEQIHSAAMPPTGVPEPPDTNRPSSTPSPVRETNAEATLYKWVALGVGVTVVLLLWLVFTIKRGARAGLSALAIVPHQLPPAREQGNYEFVSAEDWRQRAIAAEAVANKQAQILRGNLAPELAEIAKHTLVRGLSSQRTALMETQRRAQEDLAALESRLAALHLPLRERILIYENRISELEKELSNRGEEMRELIQATLSLVRTRLEEERKKEILGNGSRQA